MSWRAALKVTVATGVLGFGLLTACLILSAPPHVGANAERSTTAQVSSVTGCDGNWCDYFLSYQPEGELPPELVTIPGPEGEAQPSSTVKIYYQDANPGAARFPDTGYAGRNLNTLIGLSVIIILFAVFMLLATLVKFARFRRQRRAAAQLSGDLIGGAPPSGRAGRHGRYH